MTRETPQAIPDSGSQPAVMTKQPIMVDGACISYGSIGGRGEDGQSMQWQRADVVR
jgi:hypothetical protein